MAFRRVMMQRVDFSSARLVAVGNMLVVVLHVSRRCCLRCWVFDVRYSMFCGVLYWYQFHSAFWTFARMILNDFRMHHAGVLGDLRNARWHLRQQRVIDRRN